MSRYEDEVYKFAKKPGYSDISTGDQIRKISYASKVELNNMVRPRIRQNAMERTASMSSRHLETIYSKDVNNVTKGERL